CAQRVADQPDDRSSSRIGRAPGPGSVHLFQMTALQELGWNESIAQAYAPWMDKRHVSPGRVLIGFNYIYRVFIEGGEIDAVLAGRFKHRASSRGELPAVGD